MIQKRALRFTFNDNSSSYEELLIKAKKKRHECKQAQDSLYRNI